MYINLGLRLLTAAAVHGDANIRLPYDRGDLLDKCISLKKKHTHKMDMRAVRSGVIGEIFMKQLTWRRDEGVMMFLGVRSQLVPVNLTKCSSLFVF